MVPQAVRISETACLSFRGAPSAMPLYNDLFRSYPARLSALVIWRAGPPAAWPPCRLTSLPPGLRVAYAKPTFSLELSAKPTFSLELSAKPTFSASWRPRRPLDGPAGSLDSLRRASWRPRRLPDGPPGAQDGLRTSILAPKTGPPGAQDGPGCASWRSKGASWRPDGLCTGFMAL